MFRAILLFIICLLCFENVHCSETNVSPYRELISFLVSENKIQAKDTIGIDPFSLIYISNLLEGKEVDFQDRLGVYIFNKFGPQDDVRYILIKKGDSYAVFKENDPLSILIYLFAIKNKCPQAVDLKLLNEYVEKIVEMNKHPLLGIPKGEILLFYSALK